MPACIYRTKAVQVWLFTGNIVPGDVIEVEIRGLGTLRNYTVVDFAGTGPSGPEVWMTERIGEL
jgi:hypothetical protein